MTELVRIPFRGTELLAVDQAGRPHIVLKPALESIGVDYSGQLQRLRRRSWAGMGVTPIPTPGGIQQMVTVDVRTFLMLLATIDEKRVAEDARPLLIAYQQEIADVIERYWTQGGAINPRATEDQLATIIGRAEAQARVLRTLDGLVDPHWLEARARHVAARALGEEPEVNPADRPLTVGEYLSDRGVAGSTLRSLSSQFGKRLKGLYVAEHGTEPPSVERFVDGALRRVAGYTEADRPLFDAVWSALKVARP
ncbi:phage antirepressor N-terminal domain-containing protein [Micromonospora sp. WMMD1082]|uniref:phage antirepressor N-terminal domain-containing protein n=1 Tax=Micromonospora sp. WMMD1082 TaxID=3016104 RepID=UPI002417A7C7|nr:phage antirepressor N-terminal domain-containing protein [Micromonospora sp. WMMD1082]MDG4796173.1 phage antirepressor N-terminal domain-containing protein [Micromonospora sp. WMMD1082]